ncbi:hypothetical protein [Thalassotalea maritima]|uniref:hypothetical protein n=1 Tax=Thalassotalea maritima TaxID=3242416 RepID=UPI0035270867
MRTIISLFVVIFISGCAQVYVPPIPDYSVSKQGKIAIYVQTKNNPTHTHIGTTIFNNFEKAYPFSWNMQRSIVDSFTDELQGKLGYQVVDISDDTLATKLTNFVEIKNKQWQFTQNSAQHRNFLIEQGYEAVIVIRESPSLASLECSQYGCNEFYSQGVGLFTRSFLGMDRYHASASYDISIELLTLPIELTQLNEFRAMTQWQRKNKLVDSFNDPKVFDDITEQELKPIQDEILNYFTELAQLTGSYMNYSNPPKNEAAKTASTQ